MIAGGTHGSDLSTAFTFTVENNTEGQPRMLKIRETASSLLHPIGTQSGHGRLAGESPFVVQYVVQVGDANNDGRVLNTDFGIVKAANPTFNAADDNRRLRRRRQDSQYGARRGERPDPVVAGHQASRPLTSARTFETFVGVGRSGIARRLSAVTPNWVQCTPYPRSRVLLGSKKDRDSRLRDQQYHRSPASRRPRG